MQELIDMTFDGLAFLALIMLFPIWFPVWVYRKLIQRKRFYPYD